MSTVCAVAVRLSLGSRDSLDLPVVRRTSVKGCSPTSRLN